MVYSTMALPYYGTTVLWHYCTNGTADERAQEKAIENKQIKIEVGATNSPSP